MATVSVPSVFSGSGSQAAASVVSLAASVVSLLALSLSSLPQPAATRPRASRRAARVRIVIFTVLSSG